MKVFLSHSSKQKSYVEQVANILGKENIIYDSWTFEEGNKSLEEIYKGIEKSGIFTFFISKDSLNSDWVKNELFFAERFIDENKIKKFVPIIIDLSLNHKSEEIPEWMKKYNLKYIHKPGRSATRIKNELLSIRAENLPILAKEEQLFIGRNDEKRYFEERYYSSDEKKPIVFVVNGLPKIGKRKFIKKVLVDSNIIEIYYKPEILELDRRNSIEDLILKLYTLGFSKEHENTIENMLLLDLNKKINLCIELINELSKSGEMLIILDNQFIFSKNGDCAPWFIDLVNRFESNHEGIKFCIATMARVRESHQKFNNNSLFNQTIKEFLKHERKAYFEQLLKIHGIELNQKDQTDIIECCTGIPAQIRFAVNLLKSNEYNITECIQRIIEFNKNDSSVLIEEYEDNPLALQLLKLLSMGEFFSYSLVYSIFKDEEKEKIESLLKSFNNNLIIEAVADGIEFIKLTDSVKDYIERRNYKFEEKYLVLIKDMASKIKNSFEFIDSSEINFYMKEAIKLDIDNMPSKYLIPSFYLNAMRELYNYEKRYSVVIKLAKKVLEYERNIDPKIVKEIIYWYCLSLARLRDPKMLHLVQKIDGIDHNFILGFYYRIIGNNDKAIERLNLVLKEAPNHFRAKRELVQVYINTEQYELAYNLAKQNYESEPLNPYNIQSYFKCLIKLDDTPEKKDILRRLLDSLKNSQHEKSGEMYATSNSQFIAYIENNYNKAIMEINDVINTFPKNIYPFLVKLEIIRNRDNIDYKELNKTLSEIRGVFDKDNDIFNKLMYITCEILNKKYFLLENDSAEKYFNEKIIGRFPDKIIENIKSLLSNSGP